MVTPRPQIFPGDCSLTHGERRECLGNKASSRPSWKGEGTRTKPWLPFPGVRISRRQPQAYLLDLLRFFQKVPAQSACGRVGCGRFYPGTSQEEGPHCWLGGPKWAQLSKRNYCSSDTFGSYQQRRPSEPPNAADTPERQETLLVC